MEEGEQPPAPAANTPSSDKPARKRQKKKRNATANDDGDMDFDLSINRAVARMDSNLLANHVARQTQRFGKDLSSVELTDLTLEGKSASLFFFRFPFFLLSRAMRLCLTRPSS